MLSFLNVFFYFFLPIMRLDLIEKLTGNEVLLLYSSQIYWRFICVIFKHCIYYVSPKIWKMIWEYVFNTVWFLQNVAQRKEMHKTVFCFFPQSYTNVHQKYLDLIYLQTFTMHLMYLFYSLWYTIHYCSAIFDISCTYLVKCIHSLLYAILSF